MGRRAQRGKHLPTLHSIAKHWESVRETEEVVLKGERLAFIGFPEQIEMGERVVPWIFCIKKVAGALRGLSPG